MDKTAPNQNLLYGVIGLLLGIVLTVVVVNNQMYGMMNMMGMGRSGTAMQQGMKSDRDDNDMMDMSMREMNDELDDKTGDAFDKSFITAMIAHHEGAIDMANEAKESAGHDELKKMADDIIAAQSREIDQMKQWYKNWFSAEAPTSSYRMMH